MYFIVLYWGDVWHQERQKLLAVFLKKLFWKFGKLKKKTSYKPTIDNFVENGLHPRDLFFSKFCGNFQNNYFQNICYDTSLEVHAFFCL